MTREDEIAAKAKRISTLKSLKVKKTLRIRQVKAEAEAKIREINIMYDEDPERLKAQYAAEDYARSEKAKKRAAKRIAKEKKHLEMEKNVRKYTLGEEIFSSIVQGVGAALFIAATALLNVFAIDKVVSESRVVFLVLYNVFGGAMILNYVMSVLHHSLPGRGAKEVFKRLCRIFVFLIIEAVYLIYTYAAIKAGTISWTYGIVVTGIAVLLATVGIIMYAIAGSRLEVANIVFNAILGWGGFFICAHLFHAISTKSFTLLIIGAVFYTVGMILCVIKKVKFVHAIGNLVMLAGSVYMFFSFFFMY